MKRNKLHIGCGRLWLPDYVNIDIREGPAVDEVRKAWELSDIPNNSIEEIYVCHLLEHFSDHELKITISEFLRVLVPRTGALRLAVPDMENIAYCLREGVSLDRLSGLIWGRQDVDWNVHRRGWTYESLAADMRRWGFYDVQRWGPFEDWDDFNRAWIELSCGEKVQMSLNLLGYKI